MSRPTIVPSLAEVLTRPAFIVERALASALEPLLVGAIKPGQVWLDVGCGQRPYESLFAGASYIGLDVADSGRAPGLKKADVLYDGHTLPFPDAHAHGVLSTEVLEHVPNPARYLAEAARVLKTGGALVLTVPFFWEQHEQPFDFRRYTEFGLRRELEAAGFEIETLRKTATGAETLAQGLSILLSGSVISRVPFGRRLFLAALCAPIQLAGLALARVLPDRGDLFLNVVVLARKAPVRGSRRA